MRGEEMNHEKVTRPHGVDGDGPCMDCGQSNLLGDTYWFADNALWNEVVPEDGILCAPCFTNRCDAQGVGIGWRAGRVGDLEALAREDEGGDIEIVARHLAERDHGGPLPKDVAEEICEGYKDEARILLSRIQLARVVRTVEQGTGSDAYKGFVGELGELAKDALDIEVSVTPAPYVPCGRIMVGSGGDTYDPICDLREGHDGRCMSTAATDQLKLAEYPEGHPAREPHEKADALERELHEDA
jgi:hypothetical protein